MATDLLLVTRSLPLDSLIVGPPPWRMSFTRVAGLLLIGCDAPSWIGRSLPSTPPAPNRAACLAHLGTAGSSFLALTVAVPSSRPMAEGRP